MIVVWALAADAERWALRLHKTVEMNVRKQGAMRNRKLDAHINGAAQQAIAPDRNELVFHRELAARCRYFPAGESRR